MSSWAFGMTRRILGMPLLQERLHGLQEICPAAAIALRLHCGSPNLGIIVVLRIHRGGWSYGVRFLSDPPSGAGGTVTLSSSRIRCVGIATFPLGGRGSLASRSLRSETDSFEWGTSFVTGCPEEIPPACASQGTASPERFPAKEAGWRGNKAMRRSGNSATVMRRGAAILTAFVSFRTLVCLIGSVPSTRLCGHNNSKAVVFPIAGSSPITKRTARMKLLN